MKQFFQQILRDKNGEFSLRECVIILLVFIIIISWIGQQFLGKAVPEFMFYSFISLIAAGCFGYSIEKKSAEQNNISNQQNTNL
jgi:choline-glycine betaine transporter